MKVVYNFPVVAALERCTDMIWNEDRMFLNRNEERMFFHITRSVLIIWRLDVLPTPLQGRCMTCMVPWFTNPGDSVGHLNGATTGGTGWQIWWFWRRKLADLLGRFDVMLVYQCHKPSPIHHHFYGWYKLSKMGGLWHCYTHIILDLWASTTWCILDLYEIAEPSLCRACAEPGPRPKASYVQFVAGETSGSNGNQTLKLINHLMMSHIIYICRHVNDITCSPLHFGLK